LGEVPKGRASPLWKKRENNVRKRTLPEGENEKKIEGVLFFKTRRGVGPLEKRRDRQTLFKSKKYGVVNAEGGGVREISVNAHPRNSNSRQKQPTSKIAN